jgi:MiaB-like tRNA modifying enzyme
VIINTCTVKGATEDRIIQRLKTLRAQGHSIVVAGCLTADDKRIKKAAPEAPMVSPSSLIHIADAVEDALCGRIGKVYLSSGSKDDLPKLLTAPIARIPINEGCTSSCHFCQTKLARPYLRSYSPKSIVRWMNEAVRNGAKEIQLTSQDSGAYGIDIKTDLVSLMELISNDDSSSRVSGDFLVRLGMINPNHAKRMLPGLINALKDKRFYKFLHIPVQTGSERICEAMNRDHTVKEFEDIVDAVRAEIPEITIATDIIVGYPGESEKDFKDTLDMMRRVRPGITNVSRFSPRPGTKAKEMEQLPRELVKGRSTECHALAKRISSDANQASIGRTIKVLMTEKEKDFKGRDIDYRQVVVKRFKGNIGDMVDVRISSANHGSLFGELVSD